MVGECNRGNSEISHIEQSQNDESRSDTCSPFCICSCCSLSTADRSTAKFTSELDEAVSFHTNAVNYTTPYTDAHQNSIWQPPKA